jgi:hypothetical protein
VVILTYSGLETRAEFIQADRQLAELLARRLLALAQENGEKLSLVPARRVEDYKNTHPDWQQLDLHQIGRDLAADYVVYLEINSLSMYEKGGNQFFRGRANISVNLVDVNNPDEPPAHTSYVDVFPTDARGGISVFDADPAQFRESFLGYVAQRLSWYFSRYPKRDSYFVESPGGL